MWKDFHFTFEGWSLWVLVVIVTVPWVTGFIEISRFLSGLL